MPGDGGQIFLFNLNSLLAGAGVLCGALARYVKATGTGTGPTLLSLIPVVIVANAGQIAGRARCKLLGKHSAGKGRS